MPRLVAFDAVFFLLPFVVYAAWLLVTRGTVRNSADWPAKVIGYLGLAGAVLLVLAVVVFISFERGEPGAVYVPAKVGEDGKIIPGHFEPPPQPKPQ